MKSTLLLGKNYYSFLISFALFERNKKVVLVDDHSKDLDDKNFIFDFERVMLNTWGLDCQIQNLLDLDHYLTPGRYCIVFDGRHLNLGASPGQNYNEILRKFPRFLSLDPLKDEASREKFDLMFKKFTQDFGIGFFRFINPQDLKFESMWNILPEELKKIFLDFKEQSKKEELKYILCFLQGFYQNLFSFELSDFDLLFILLFLLSPRFEINRKKFEDDLAKYFKKHGGEVISGEKPTFQIKGFKVNEFSLNGMDPLKLEKLFLTNGEFFGVPLNTDHQTSYTSIKIRLNIKNHDLMEKEFILSSSDRIGGSHPFTRLKFEKDGLIGEVLIPLMVGSKDSFDEKSVLEIIFKNLETVLGKCPEGHLKISSNYSRKFWNQESTETINWPFFQKPIKNLYIYHAPRSNPLGGALLLAQIKDERGHIL